VGRQGALASRGAAEPTFLDVLPALALTVVLLAVPLAVVLMLAIGASWWACLGTATIAISAGLASLRLIRGRHRAPATAKPVPVPARASAAFPRMPARAPYPASAEQVDVLDDAGYRAAVAALLDRDGWTVREIPVADDVHLVGTHRADRSRIGLRCLRGELTDGQDGAAPLRPVGAPPAGAPTGSRWLMVSTGSWSRATVRWAARNNVRLVDGPMLTRWCAGTGLAELLDLAADHPAATAR
jgi:hypothetical protein